MRIGLEGIAPSDDVVVPPALTEARLRYGPRVSPVDVRHYIYGTLHAPDWRERFAEEAETSALRFPWVPPADYSAFRDAGAELMFIHADYDNAPARQEPVLEVEEGAEIRIGKKGMRWRRVKTGEGVWEDDLSCLEIGEGLRLTGIPIEAHDYRVAGYSPVQWAAKNLIPDPEAGEDPLRDPRWADNPTELVCHLRRLIYVGCRTAEIIGGLPPSLTG